MSKLEKVFKDINVTCVNKIRITETVVFSISTYGSDNWTMRRNEGKDFMLLS